MKRPAVVLLLLTLSTPTGAVQFAQQRPSYRDGEVVVKYRAGPVAARAGLKAALGLEKRRDLAGGRAELLQVPAITSTAAILELLRAEPLVEYAEPNFLRYPSAFLPNDPQLGAQWGVLNTGQGYEFGGPVPPNDAPAAGADLNLTQAWDENGDGIADRTGNGSVILAIIDDGFQLNHPDLVFIAGRDFVDDDANPSGGEHGTLVAGAAGAVGHNGIGVAGAIWNVRLMPLRFDFGTAQLVEALDFARTNGAHIVNASFGGPGFSQLELEAIERLRGAGILLVAAAGNSDSNTDLGVANYPANYDLDNILAVAASNRGDNITGFSQYGPATTEVAAPGTEIRTTAVGSTYESVAGTSFSSPYTAGVAALVKNYVPGADYREIIARIVEGAVGGVGTLDNASALRTRGGRVDAARALDMAPGPALVLAAYTVDAAGNGRLDPGESATLSVTVENLWLEATSAGATLALVPACGAPVSVGSGTQVLGTVPAAGSATADFTITADAAISGHCYVDAQLRLTADGGYDRTRFFRLEIGRLPSGTLATGSLQTDKFDEFHAWHVDVPAVPPGASGIRFRTTAPTDIDLLVKHGTAPQYAIQLAEPPEPGEGQLFFTDADVVGGESDGNEDVSLPLQAGTYHLVVVNFSQQAQNYTIRADLVQAGTLSFSASAYEVDESAGTATITVERLTGSAGNASVRYAATAGSARATCDFNTTSGTLTWANDDTSAKTFTVAITNDTFEEGAETIQLALSSPTGAALGATPNAVLSVAANDVGGAGGGDTVSFASTLVTANEGQPSATLTVNRSCGGSQAPGASVDFATVDGSAIAASDYQSGTGTLTWAGGDLESKLITVPLINDTVQEPSEGFTVTLTNAVAVAVSGLSTANVTIQDNDAAGGSTGGGGGGGALDGGLLLLLLAAARRRPAR